MNLLRNTFKWMLLTLLIGVGGGGLVFGGWDVAKGVAPEEVCAVYKEVIHSIAVPGFMPRDDCSWIKRDLIGHFTVNGVPFTIPRDYLWQGRSTPDGPVDALYIMMRYSEMQPAPAFPYHDLNVKVDVFQTSGNIHCDKFNKCGSISKIHYLYESGIDRCELYPWNCVYDQVIPERINETTDDGIKSYTAQYGARDIFFSGDIQSPDFWFVCTPYPQNDQGVPYPSCETWLQLNDKFYVKLYFRRSVLDLHLRKVHDGVLHKLETFMVENNVAITNRSGLEN